MPVYRTTHVHKYLSTYVQAMFLYLHAHKPHPPLRELAVHTVQYVVFPFARRQLFAVFTFQSHFTIISL